MGRMPAIVNHHFMTVCNFTISFHMFIACDWIRFPYDKQGIERLGNKETID